MVHMVARRVRRFNAALLSATRMLEEGSWTKNVVKTYPNLEVLQLNGMQLCDAEYKTFSSLRKLKEIDLFECGSVSDAAVVSLAEQCPLLQSLTIGGSLRRYGM